MPVVAAGAVAAVAVAAVGLSSVAGPSTERPVAGSSDSTGIDEPLTGLGVAESYRPVGALGLVIEVPETWGTNDVACNGSPMADTVAFDSGRACQVLDPPRVSSLRIADARDLHVVDVLPELDMLPTRVGDVELRLSSLVDLDGLWTFAVAGMGRDDGRVAVLRSEDQQAARHALESLRVIPDGWVTIPSVRGLKSDEAQGVLADLGLSSVVQDVPNEEFEVGRVVATNPPIAAVVPEDQEIEILRAS